MKELIFFFLRNLLPVLICLAAPALSGAEGLRVGVIMTGDVPYYAEMHKSFVEELNRKLPADNQVEVILQRPFPDHIAWSNAARKLIAFDVDLIVTYGSPATLAVLEEKSDIPVVYSGVYNPDGIDIQGKNVTGCGYKVPLSSLIRYLKRIQHIDVLRVVFSSIEEDSSRQANELAILARQQNVKLTKVNIRSKSDIQKLKNSTGDDAVILTGSALVHLWIDELMTVLRDEKDPVADIFPDAGENGVLLTLYRPPEEQGEMAAEMTARILKGEDLDLISSDSHGDTELVFNLIEAQKIGLKLPVGLLVEATKVIK